MSRALAHRGPDDDGTWCDTQVTLAHRRLSIIDPGSGGRQPMVTPDGRYVLVFNGEVYNYRELRATLTADGAQFTTHSDTEVLLQLLVRHGPGGLDAVRGMFALALWDTRERTLLVARDRFGMKPLYVAGLADGVAFASEVRALRRASLATAGVNPAGVLAYLAWGYVPAPLTWTRGVDALSPGTWRSWRADGESQGGAFAQPGDPYHGDDLVDEAALCERVRHALSDSVAAHLVADVPVGVFLSGGVDSTALVAAARQRAGGVLHTFTLGGDVAALSEVDDAAAVAAAFGTTHHGLTVDAPAVQAALPHIVTSLDAPTCDAVNSYLVAHAVAATGVKAVLSGAGGDELFGGYPSFARIPTALALARVAGPAFALAAAASARLSSATAARYRHFASRRDLQGAYRAQRGHFMPDEWPALLGPAFDGQVGHEAVETLRSVEGRVFAVEPGEAPQASVARLETRGYLQGQLLRDIDAVSMAHGLEVRTPFVDHVLQRAVWPALARHADLLRGKTLLKRTLPANVPAGVLTRPKRGFTLPFDTWMRAGLREWTMVGIESVVADGWIARHAAERVVQDWRRGRAHWSRVWTVSVLGQFLRAA